MCQAHEQTHAKEPAFSNETGGNSIVNKTFVLHLYFVTNCDSLFYLGA